KYQQGGRQDDVVVLSTASGELGDRERQPAPGDLLLRDDDQTGDLSEGEGEEGEVGAAQTEHHEPEDGTQDPRGDHAQRDGGPDRAEDRGLDGDLATPHGPGIARDPRDRHVTEGELTGDPRQQGPGAGETRRVERPPGDVQLAVGPEP